MSELQVSTSLRSEVQERSRPEGQVSEVQSGSRPTRSEVKCGIHE